MIKIDNISFEGTPLLLAPMEDISDPPFRRLCKRFGADIVYTEFISSEGLVRNAEKSLQKLDFDESERPIGIQLFGNKPDIMAEAAMIVSAVNPDLIDINFGCPVRKVTMKGGGAGLLNDIPKMVEITKAVVKATKLPVTVKTRLGWDEKNKDILNITLRLQDAGIRAITIHGRTKAAMYRGSADWTLIGEVKSHPCVKIPVIGNGDIKTGPEALDMKQKFNVDGIMIGRAATGNPWVFSQIKHFFKKGEILPPPSTQEVIAICREHLKSSVNWKGERTAIFEMRKHYSNYFKGFPGIKDFRTALVNSNSFDDINRLLDEWQKNNFT